MISLKVNGAFYDFTHPVSPAELVEFFNLSEKKPFYDFSMETIKVCYVKPYKSSYHWKVDVPATPTQ